MMRALYVPFRDGAPVPSEAREIHVAVEPVVRHKSVVDFGATVGVTRRQNDALEFIRSYIGEHGYAPSYREIADGLGIGKSRVAAIVKDLDMRGQIRRLPGRSRAIEAIDATNEKGPDDAGHSRPVPPAGSGHENGRQMDEVR